MMETLRSYTAIEPRIYAYQTPDVQGHEGWTKVGEARRQTVEARIAQQTKTAGLRWRLCWARPARFADGKDLRDTAFHGYLEAQGVERMRHYETGRKLEWFRVGGEASLAHFEAFVQKGVPGGGERSEYFLRSEQAEAVLRAKDYFERGGREFLWNAKPRFGKTLAAYDLVRQMGCRKVLILTNRPAVADGWVSDFARFIGWQTDLVFVSDNEGVRKRREVLSRQSYVGLGEDKGFVAFESLQGLKGSKYFGGDFDKLHWMTEIDFDLVLLDEAHEGTETEKAAFALERLRWKHCLHLSGTPFKQLASGDFTEGQIFTWSYVDEQEAKAAWAGEENNPYEALPRLKLLTYQLSPMIEARVEQGYDEDHAYAFSLTEFFKTKANKTFVYEDKVRAFLKALTTQSKYPFSTPELRAELRHTLWVLNHVDSAKALAQLLAEEGSGFEGYEIVIAAGDGRGVDGEGVISERALERVRTAIAKSGKPTITLSVGQLTVGVTVPEWTGILMLNTLKSAAAYFQATFRVQNPHVCLRDGQMYMKEEAYVFDFDPTRTLELFAQLANESVPELEGEALAPEERRERKIRTLLNFFPVIGEDEAGEMVELNVAEVLAIPRRLKCQEVVNRGFMSNFLFRIDNLFRNPEKFERIINKLPAPESFHAAKKPADDLSLRDDALDEAGNVALPEEAIVGRAKELFGDKVYTVESLSALGMSEREAERYKEGVTKTVTQKIVPAATEGLPKSAQRKVAAEMGKALEERFAAVDREYRHTVAEVEAEYAARSAEVGETEAARSRLDEEKEATLTAAAMSRDAALHQAAETFLQEAPVTAVRLSEGKRAEERKQSIQDQARDRLRGFARTIPSFLMAYGDDRLTLANFDAYIDDATFKEVTGITLGEFRELRDEGRFFDESVFNDAVQTFLKKKRDLADYFSGAHEEDIFDYIPPQKTNQIFTPRKVVLRMVDALEQENPGCFDDPSKTFADLYAKSGLYLAEIAKRLYKSPELRRHFPDGRERLRHIFTKQLYAMAPTRIVHLIVLEYLLGFDPALRQEAEAHIVQADAALAAQEGRLAELVAEKFG